MTKLILCFKGGPGSGFQDHAGRPGKQGGSAPKDGSDDDSVDKRISFAKQQIKDYVRNRDDWYLSKSGSVVGMSMKTPIGNVVNIFAMGGVFNVKSYGESYNSFGSLNEAVKRAKRIGKWLDDKDKEAGIKSRTGKHSYIMNDEKDLT